MIISKTNNNNNFELKINDCIIQLVNKYQYLETLLESNHDQTEDINRSIDRIIASWSRHLGSCIMGFYDTRVLNYEYIVTSFAKAI